ncbi:hypothetical protein AGMMS49587_18300 [Spirochaetia bacterium]|nr:hypothetical protein AGMMS49587_18300 [Spirochaetia bacterium]
MKRSIIVVLALVLGLAQIYAGAKAEDKAPGGGSNAAALELLRVGVMTDSTTDYALSIGESEGIWVKNGLKIESAGFAMGINTIDAVTLGQMDVGFGADFAVLNRLGGSATSPLRIFAGLGASSPDSWKYYAREDLKTPADLAGKSSVVQLGTVVEYWLSKTLSNFKVNPASVKLLPVESPMEGVALVQNGSAAGMWASARAAETVSKIPGVHAIADLSGTGAPTVSVVLATEQFLKEHQSAAAKYLKSMQEIWDFMDKNPQRAAEIINKASGTPVEQVLINLQAGSRYIKFDQEVFDTLQNLYNWTNEQGIIKYPYDLKKYINVDALNAAYPGREQFK